MGPGRRTMVRREDLQADLDMVGPVAKGRRVVMRRRKVRWPVAPAGRGVGRAPADPMVGRADPAVILRSADRRRIAAEAAFAAFPKLQVIASTARHVDDADSHRIAARIDTREAAPATGFQEVTPTIGANSNAAAASGLIPQNGTVASQVEQNTVTIPTSPPPVPPQWNYNNPPNWVTGAPLLPFETPVNLTKRQQELLREFDKEGDNRKTNPESEGFFARVKEFFEDLRE